VKAVRWTTLAIRLERLARKVKTIRNDSNIRTSAALLVDDIENLELYRPGQPGFSDQRRHIEEAQKPKVVAQ